MYHSLFTYRTLLPYGRPFVSKLWHDVRAVFSHVYLQSFLLHDIRAFFCHVYLRVIPKYMTIFLETRIYMRTKKPYTCVTNKHVVYGVTVSHRIRGTELYRQQKTSSCTMEQDLVVIHCSHSSGGCWLPHNGFVGIRGLSLERLCTLFLKCWPKQRSIQLEISVRQAKHDSLALDNVKHDLESLLEQIGFSSFLSRARIITFSPPRTRSKPPSLEAFYYFPGILTDCNSLPPASLSLVLPHFNCDFHGSLTPSRSTCIKCPLGINLLLVLKFIYNFSLAFFCS